MAFQPRAAPKVGEEGNFGGSDVDLEEGKRIALVLCAWQGGPHSTDTTIPGSESSWFAASPELASPCKPHQPHSREPFWFSNRSAAEGGQALGATVRIQTGGIV